MRDALLDGGRARLLGIVAAAVVVLMLLAYGLAHVLVGDNPAPARSAAIARLKPVLAGAILAAADAKPTKLDTSRGMGSLRAGLAVVALSEVDKVQTRSGPRRAPEGSTLLAFRLGDWACETTPCLGWRTLEPQVVVDGISSPLPDGGDTFVVAIAPGVEDVELSINADGYRQSLSLLEDSAGTRNIELLAVPDQEKRLELGSTFRLVEHTSIPLLDSTGQTTDSFPRDLTVEYAQRRFFLEGATPSSPRKAFLIVNTYFSYAGQTQRFVPLEEVTFVDRNGAHYRPLDLNPDPAVALLGFEIPADIKAGDLEIGGTTTKTSSTGQPYDSTLDTAKVPIKFG